MSFHGVPLAYQGRIPINGISVELYDLECRTLVLSQIMLEHLDLDEEEMDEKFRQFKITAMRNIREQNEATVRRNRVAASLGINPNKPILGPDGNPLG
jgi:hypothetical protein